MSVNRIVAVVGLFSLLALSICDSKFHFDKNLVEAKTKNYSAQRNWNIHYGQDSVFKNSSVRYQADFEQMKKVLKPGSVVISDLTSSYYIAAQLPVYIRNAHRHHNGSTPQLWRFFLEKRYGCYLEFEENRQKLATFIREVDKFDYWLVNKDGINTHRKRDCLAFRSRTLEQQLPKVARRVFDGEFFDLYEMNRG